MSSSHENPLATPPWIPLGLTLAGLIYVVLAITMATAGGGH